MTEFQLLLIGASAFFGLKIYEHILTLDKNVDNQPEEDFTDDEADTTTLIEKADAEALSGNLQMALAILSEANIKHPNNGETLFKMGFVLGLQERFEEALEDYQEALDVDPKNPFCHLEMGLIYLKKGENINAIKHFNSALELDPELESAKVELDKLLVHSFNKFR